LKANTHLGDYYDEFLDDKSDEYIQWFIRTFEEKCGKGS
jgi:hypothetical protein